MLSFDILAIIFMVVCVNLCNSYVIRTEKLKKLDMVLKNDGATSNLKCSLNDILCGAERKAELVEKFYADICKACINAVADL